MYITFPESMTRFTFIFWHLSQPYISSETDIITNQNTNWAIILARPRKIINKWILQDFQCTLENVSHLCRLLSYLRRTISQQQGNRKIIIKPHEAPVNRMIVPMFGAKTAKKIQIITIKVFTTSIAHIVSSTRKSINSWLRQM